MTKDGDLIDTLPGMIFSFFGWIFGGIAKLIMAIIAGLFKGIVGLLKKNGIPVAG